MTGPVVTEEKSCRKYISAGNPALSEVDFSYLAEILAPTKLNLGRGKSQIIFTKAKSNLIDISLPKSSPIRNSA